jgi:photosystem II stability/assembly factor-like uncharacterized protein
MTDFTDRELCLMFSVGGFDGDGNDIACGPHNDGQSGPIFVSGARGLRFGESKRGDKLAHKAKRVTIGKRTPDSANRRILVAYRANLVATTGGAFLADDDTQENWQEIVDSRQN